METHFKIEDLVTLSDEISIVQTELNQDRPSLGVPCAASVEDDRSFC